MCRRIFLCMILLVLFFCSSCSSRSNDTHETTNAYQITYNWYLQSNNHVGNDWTYTVTYNGNRIPSGSYITGTEGTFIRIYIKTTEKDRKPDNSSGTLQIPLKHGTSKSTIITVREGHGRYAGNTAKWKFTCTIRKT